MAYTYLIRCIPENKVYYGVRYAKGCYPEELGKKYFSSSKHMKKLFNKYNISDFKFEIRKKFTDEKKAVEWENKVLRRMNVIKRSDFINKTDNKAISKDASDPTGRKHSIETKKKMSEAWRYRHVSDETKKKMSLSAKLRGSNRTDKVHSDETKKKMSETRKQYYKLNEHPKGMKGKSHVKASCMFCKKTSALWAINKNHGDCK